MNVVLMHLRRKKPTELLAEDLERRNSNGESPRELGCGDASMLGAIDRLNLAARFASCRSVTNRFSCSMTSWGTSTAKLQPRCNALSAIQNPSFTRPVSACSCCCMGAKGKQNTISPPQRAEMQPSPELDRKGTRTSRID